MSELTNYRRPLAQAAFEYAVDHKNGKHWQDIVDVCR